MVSVVSGSSGTAGRVGAKAFFVILSTTPLGAALGWAFSLLPVSATVVAPLRRFAASCWAALPSAEEVVTAVTAVAVVASAIVTSEAAAVAAWSASTSISDGASDVSAG